MYSDIFNAHLHEADGVTILTWMLWRWQLNPQASLVVITSGGDGNALYHRVYTALSKIRKQIRSGNNAQLHEFGMQTATSQWTEIKEDGTELNLDAVYYKRVIEQRHIMSEIFATMDFGIKKGR